MKNAPASVNQAADFAVDTRVLFLTFLAFGVGCISTLVAWALVALIAMITNAVFFEVYSPHLAPITQNRFGLCLPLVPALGGLIIGLIARFGSERIRGHGIPEALEAIIFGQSKMQLKVALLKPISSAISIGTGGPFGAEGPIIMTGGAFGSLFAQMFHLSASERKIILVAGSAAGMTAIFNTPVAAALFAVELLLFEWRPRSLIPIATACAAAWGFRVCFFGGEPLFPIPPHELVASAPVLGASLALGLLAGACSGVLTSLVYGFEDVFEKLPLHWMWWPSIGGFVVGVIGFFDLRVLGVGYDIIGDLLHGKILGASALLLLVGKGVAWSFALGSGTSGGVLAPLLILGGALGGLFGGVVHAADGSLWVLVGMAAMMGGTMRCPFTAIVFALELTGDVRALPALFTGAIAADAVTVLILRRSILTEKVARRGYHISRDYAVDPFDALLVRDVMDPSDTTVCEDALLTDLCAKIDGGDAALRRHQGIPLTDSEGLLSGILTRGDVLRALRSPNFDRLRLSEVGTKTVIVAYADEILRTAVDKMLQNDIGRLPVVKKETPDKVIGYLGRNELMRARRHRLEEESKRESIWSEPTE